MFALRVAQTLMQWDWPFRLMNPLMGQFNPFLPEHRENPYPHYQALRESSRLYWHPLLRMWILTGYDEICAALSDRRLSVDRTQTPMFDRLVPQGAIDPEFLAAIKGSLLMTDAPDHNRLRSLVSKAFTPRVIEQLEPQLSDLADVLLDKMEHKCRQQGEVDFLREFAYPFPIITIANMMGIPPEDHDQLKSWSDALSSLLNLLQKPGGLRQAEQAFHPVRDYFRDIFQQRRRQPEEDLISNLVAVEQDGDRLSEAELVSICVLIMAAGHETTSSLLGTSLWTLLQHPRQLREFIDRPELTASAVEEILRFDSPVQMYDRVAVDDFELVASNGEIASVRKGQLVTTVIGAGNRDPQRFELPDELQLDRSDNRHLSFSWGPHFCLGAALARLEAQLALRKILQRYPDLAGPKRQPEHHRSHVLRGFKCLPLRLGSPASGSMSGRNVGIGVQANTAEAAGCPFSTSRH